MTDDEIETNCKLCRCKIDWACYDFPNKDKKFYICDNCGDDMKWLHRDLIKDGVKFIRRIRCEKCNFNICVINNKPTCLWCLNDNVILKHKVLYDIYNGKTHGFVLFTDFKYCINQLNFRTNNGMEITKLVHLTKKIINREEISKRWC